MGMCWCSDHLQQGQPRKLPTEDGVALEVARLEQEEIMVGMIAHQILQMDVTVLKEMDGSTGFFPAEVNTRGGISSSLTTCPTWALFRRSSSILIPRPNLNWKSNHQYFTMFNIFPGKKEVERD
jgi:hypothetical protein